MKIMTSGLLLGLLFGSASVGAAPADPPLAIAPMKIWIAKAVAGELAANGTVMDKTTLLDTIAGADVLDKKGKPLLHVDKAGLVTGPDVTRKVTLSPAGDITVDDGSTWQLRDDGVVLAVDKAGKKVDAGIRFEGMTPATRRTASMLFLVATMERPFTPLRKLPAAR